MFFNITIRNDDVTKRKLPFLNRGFDLCPRWQIVLARPDAITGRLHQFRQYTASSRRGNATRGRLTVRQRAFDSEGNAFPLGKFFRAIPAIWVYPPKYAFGLPVQVARPLLCLQPYLAGPLFGFSANDQVLIRDALLPHLSAF